MILNPQEIIFLFNKYSLNEKHVYSVGCGPGTLEKELANNNFIVSANDLGTNIKYWHDYLELNNFKLYLLAELNAPFEQEEEQEKYKNVKIIRRSDSQKEYDAFIGNSKDILLFVWATYSPWKKYVDLCIKHEGKSIISIWDPSCHPRKDQLEKYLQNLNINYESFDDIRNFVYMIIQTTKIN